MVRTFIGSVAFAAILLNAAPAAASSKPAPATLTEWVENTNDALSRSIVTPRDGTTGKATITFRRGQDGRAADVTIVGGNRSVAHAARATIARMGPLAPLPLGVNPNHRIKMSLLIGDYSRPDKYETDRKVMLADAQARNLRMAQKLSGPALASLGRAH